MDTIFSCVLTIRRVTIIALIITFLIHGLVGECPRLCECKWKNGKESVMCLNANLSGIPKKLDVGTQVLDLTGNDIITVQHEAFSTAGLLNLQKVFIIKCKLKIIERYAFRNLINLVELDLSNNALAMIPSHSFDSIPELRDLKLNGNPILKVLNDAFIHVPQLVRLELSDCRIGSIEVRAFSGLETTLEWLKLDGNKLMDIKAGTLTSFHNLHGVELGKNPWNCSCSLRPTREWMLKHKIPYNIPPVCRFPIRLAGKSWDRLDLDDFACIPQIWTSNRTAYGIEGKNITMSCRVDGIPEPNVRWILRNRIIANISGNAVLPASQGRKLYIVNLQKDASNLTILTADVQDAGVYICSAENKAGKAETSVVLAVSKRPIDDSANTKIIIACVIVSILFIVISSLIGICICFWRRRRKLKQWNSHRRSNSYEKIEMNHKPLVGNNSNNRDMDCRQYNNENGGIAIVGPMRRNGGYRNVPSEDDGTGCEDNLEQNCLGGNKIKETRMTWKNCGESDVNGHINEKGVEKKEMNASDLHIPRLIDLRCDPTSESGPSLISNNYDSSNANPLVGFKPNFPQHIMRKQVLPGNNINIYTSETIKRVKSKPEEERKPQEKEVDYETKYPDLLDILTLNSSNNSSINHNKNSTAFCTLPRRNKTYSQGSQDSQSSLLPEGSSRYSSGNFNENKTKSRRCSIESYSNFPVTNYSGDKRTGYSKQRSSSFLNLVSPGNVSTRNYPSLPSSPIKEIPPYKLPSATPLLDFSALPSQVPLITTPSPSTSTSMSAYDYHAAQLERFLEEYRSLQDQLTKMKETCDTIRKKDQPIKSIGQSVKIADPLMYNAADVMSDDSANPKSILKTKKLPGQPPDPPPYWLHRSAMIKRLNHQTDSDDMFHS